MVVGTASPTPDLGSNVAGVEVAAITVVKETGCRPDGTFEVNKSDVAVVYVRNVMLPATESLPHKIKNTPGCKVIVPSDMVAV